MVYTTIDYFLLIFFDLDLSFVKDVVFDFSVSIFGLLNSAIIFSASLVLISFDVRLIFDLINSMTSNDGWCKYLDRTNKRCTIYETRPHFCRVDQFSILFKEYLKFGDKFLIDCCKQHISSNYGKKSEVMKKFKYANIKKWILI